MALLQWLKKVVMSNREASETKSPFMSVTIVPACIPCPVASPKATFIVAILSRD